MVRLKRIYCFNTFVNRLIIIPVIGLFYFIVAFIFTVRRHVKR